MLKHVPSETFRTGQKFSFGRDNKINDAHLPVFYALINGMYIIPAHGCYRLGLASMYSVHQ